MSSRTSFGPFILDRERRQLTRNGQSVPVSHRGYVLIETLLDADGDPVPKDVLMDRAWPGAPIEEGNLTVQVSALRRQLGEGSDALIVTVPRIGYRLVVPPAAPEARPDRGPPLVAVLPFANLGNGSDDGYFADGVVDEIITTLSRFKSFAVISRGSSFALRDRGGDARAAARDLGVRYALEGSVRRAGDQLRVTAQLLDTASGVQLWADRHDGALADIFSFQDRIAARVVGVVEPTIRKAEIERARRKPVASLDAYDLYLRALPMVYAPGPERHEEAIELLTRAAALDPGFALPRAYAGLVYETRIALRAPPLGNRDAETCVELAREALALGGDDPMVRAICGLLLYRVGKDISVLDGLRAAVRENPHSVVILTHAAQAVGMHGCLEESIDYHMRAYALSPGSPEAYQNLFGIGASHFLLGNHEAAIDWSLKSLATFNNLIHTYITLACCYVARDRLDDARAMVRRIHEINPTLTLKTIEDGADEEDPYAFAVLPGLREAGLPER